MNVIPPDQAAKDRSTSSVRSLHASCKRTGETEILKSVSRLVDHRHLQDISFQEEKGERTTACTVLLLEFYLLMTIAASFRWVQKVFDVFSAFLRGAIEAEVYFRFPCEGLSGMFERSLFKAIKGVSCLRVSSRLWCKKAKVVLEDAS